MGVVTSKMHALAWRGLQVVGAAPYLGCLIGADDCAKHKPDPAPILLGCERMGAAQECVYVGDSPFDIAAGNAAAARPLRLRVGHVPEEELVVENPTGIIHEVAEFSAAIQALSN